MKTIVRYSSKCFTYVLPKSYFMATVNVIIKKNKQKKNGEYPLYLKVTKDRKTNYLSLGYSIKETDWDDKLQKVKKSYKNYLRLNNFINHKKLELEEVAIKSETEDKYIKTEEIKGIIRNKYRISFIDYFNDFLFELEKKNQIRTHLRANTVLNKLNRYTGNKNLLFDDVDINFLKEYDTHLRTYYGNKENTITSNFKIIKQIIKRAVKEDIIPYDKNPFLKFQLKWESSNTQYLKEDEIQRIEELNLTPDTNIYHVKNIFLFAIYTAGLRVSDVLLLKWSDYDGERIVVDTQKTKSVVSIKLIDKSKQILSLYENKCCKPNDYIFPFMKNDAIPEADKRELLKKISTKTAICNNYLKKIAALACIDKKLHFHSSRHTFACMALRKGVRIEHVSKLLGHSDIKTTQIYAKIVNSDLDDSMMLLN